MISTILILIILTGQRKKMTIHYLKHRMRIIVYASTAMTYILKCIQFIKV